MLQGTTSPSIPNASEVIDALTALGGTADAVSLRDEMTRRGFPVLGSQLAMQRATDGSEGPLVINKDWTLSLRS